MSIYLPQREADALLQLEKHYRNHQKLLFPTYGGLLEIPLLSEDNREEFVLSVWRSKIELKHNTIQTRTRRTIILARLDISGPTHRNPDDKLVPCPHLHFYRTGFNDKWAKPLPDFFTKPDDTLETLDQFMDFCAVVTKPSFLKELFS